MLKQLRKIGSYLIISCVITILAACDYGYRLYFKNDRVVAIIELIYYDNSNATDKSFSSSLLDIDKLEILDVLDNENIEFFLDELNMIRTYSGGKSKQVLFSHDGIGIRIIYIDNSFDIITLSDIDGGRFFVGEYDNMATVIRKRDESNVRSMVRDFNNLIDKYFH